MRRCASRWRSRGLAWRTWPSTSAMTRWTSHVKSARATKWPARRCVIWQRGRGRPARRTSCRNRRSSRVVPPLSASRASRRAIPGRPRCRKAARRRWRKGSDVRPARRALSMASSSSLGTHEPRQVDDGARRAGAPEAAGLDDHVERRKVAGRPHHRLGLVHPLPTGNEQLDRPFSEVVEAEQRSGAPAGDSGIRTEIEQARLAATSATSPARRRWRRCGSRHGGAGLGPAPGGSSTRSIPPPAAAPGSRRRAAWLRSRAILVHRSMPGMCASAAPRSEADARTRQGIRSP